jgi:hypothetical protein
MNKYIYILIAAVGLTGCLVEEPHAVIYRTDPVYYAPAPVVVVRPYYGPHYYYAPHRRWR